MSKRVQKPMRNTKINKKGKRKTEEIPMLSSKTKLEGLYVVRMLTLDEIKGVFTEDELLLIAATCGTLGEWFNIEPYQLANPSLLTDYLYTPELVDLSKEMNCSVDFIEMVRKVESLTPAQIYFLNDWLFEALGGDLMACLQELAA